MCQNGAEALMRGTVGFVLIHIHFMSMYLIKSLKLVDVANFFSVTGLVVKSNTKDLGSSLFSIPPFILYLR